MPAMANITVKNAANTDVVLVSKTPAPGDRSPARWSVDAAHSVPGFRPVLEVMTRDNGSKNGRIMEANFSAPIVQLVNGVDTLVAKVPIKLYATLPQNVSASAVNDAFVIATNTFAATLIREVASTGYSPS